MKFTCCTCIPCKMSINFPKIWDKLSWIQQRVYNKDNKCKQGGGRQTYVQKDAVESSGTMQSSKISNKGNEKGKRDHGKGFCGTCLMRELLIFLSLMSMFVQFVCCHMVCSAVSAVACYADVSVDVKAATCLHDRLALFCNLCRLHVMQTCHWMSRLLLVFMISWLCFVTVLFVFGGFLTLTENFWRIVRCLHKLVEYSCLFQLLQIWQLCLFVDHFLCVQKQFQFVQSLND